MLVAARGAACATRNLPTTAGNPTKQVTTCLPAAASPGTTAARPRRCLAALGLPPMRMPSSRGATLQLVVAKEEKGARGKVGRVERGERVDRPGRKRGRTLLYRALLYSALYAEPYYIGPYVREQRDEGRERRAKGEREWLYLTPYAGVSL